MTKLQKKARACTGPECLEALQKELADLMNAHQRDGQKRRPQNSRHTGPGGKDGPGRCDDPVCFDMIHNPEKYGAQCRPVEVTVNWDASIRLERTKGPADTFKWKLSDYLKGRIVQTHHPGSKERAIDLYADVPHKDCVEPPELLNVSAELWDQNVLYRWDKELSSSSPNRFKVDFRGGYADPSIGYRSVKGSNEKPSASITSSDIIVIEHADEHLTLPAKKIHLDLSDNDPIHLDYETLRQIITKGELSRTFTFRQVETSPEDRLIISGNVTIKVTGKPPGYLKVAPNTNFEAVRYSPKKKYTPRRKTYQVSNTGKTDITYQVSTAAGWLKIDNSKGTLKPGRTQKVTLSLTPAADAIKEDETRALIQFKNTKNRKGDTTRRAVLRTVEKWRLTVLQKDDLFFGHQYLYAGVAARVKTVLEFEVKKGKYHNGNARVFFESINGISHPPGVFNCSPGTSAISQTAFPVPGKISGKSATLYFPFGNSYRVGYHCDLDAQRLRDHYRKKWDLIMKKHISKKNPSAKTIKKWQQDVKGWIDSDVKSKRKAVSDRHVSPLEYNGSSSGSTIWVPLRHNWKEEWGTPKSVNYLRMQIRRLE